MAKFVVPDESISVALDSLMRNDDPIYNGLLATVRRMVNESVTVNLSQRHTLHVQIQLAVVASQIYPGDKSNRLLELALPIATWLNTCHE